VIQKDYIIWKFNHFRAHCNAVQGRTDGMQKNPCNVNSIPSIKTGFPVRKRDCQINENLKLQFFLFPRKKIDFFFQKEK
jgi:hypothetical protein